MVDPLYRGYDKLVFPNILFHALNVLERLEDEAVSYSVDICLRRQLKTIEKVDGTFAFSVLLSIIKPRDGVRSHSFMVTSI